MKKLRKYILTFAALIVISISAAVFGTGTEIQAADFQWNVSYNMYRGIRWTLELPSGFPLTRNQILIKARDRAAYLKNNQFSYGNAIKNPAFDDSERIVSCDRYVQWVFYDLGFRDLPKRQGLVVYSPNPDYDLAAWCEAHGFQRIGSKKELLAGDIVFLKKPDRSYPDHVYLLGQKQEDGLWQRYDCGSVYRIRSDQPFTEPIDYPGHPFAFAYRLVLPQVIWTSSDPSVVRVDDEGNIDTLKPGNCVITAKAGSREMICHIRVASQTPVVSSEKILSSCYTGNAVIGGKTFFIQDGKKYTGMRTIQGVCYYYRDGKKFTGTRQISGVHYFYRQGLKYTGIRKINGVSYYYREGKKFTGTHQVRGIPYYYRNGKRLTGTHQINGVPYFYKSGKKFTGTRQISGIPYYYKNGRRFTGIRTVSGTRYYYRNGRKYTGFLTKKGSRYYYKGGKSVKGWQKIGGYYYYFDPKTHIMQRSRWIGNWYVNAQGICIGHK